MMSRRWQVMASPGFAHIRERSVNSCFAFTKIILKVLYLAGIETNNYDQQPTAQTCGTPIYTSATPTYGEPSNKYRSTGEQQPQPAPARAQLLVVRRVVQGGVSPCDYIVAFLCLRCQRSSLGSALRSRERHLLKRPSRRTSKPRASCPRGRARTERFIVGRRTSPVTAPRAGTGSSPASRSARRRAAPPTRPRRTSRSPATGARSW